MAVLKYALKLAFIRDRRALKRLVLQMEDRFSQNKTDFYGLEAQIFHCLNKLPVRERDVERRKFDNSVKRESFQAECRKLSNEQLQQTKMLEKMKKAKDVSLSELREKIKEEMPFLKENCEQTSTLKLTVSLFDVHIERGSFNSELASSTFQKIKQGKESASASIERLRSIYEML